VLAAKHRQRCQKSFQEYCKDPELFPNEPPAKHHAFMIGALEGVAAGQIKRLMVLMPPGHGKSVYCSIRFPSWYLGKNPKHYLVHATYGGELASLNGRKVRNLIDSEEYQAIFPNITIAEDFKGRADWATKQGGQYYATGVGGGITGRRAHGALLDDLVKDRKEADSITKRETVWDWYKTALRTRLRKDGWIVFVNTRWHEDDPAGRILPDTWSGESGWVSARDGEQWYVIRLPAIAEQGDQLGRAPGEPLWPAEKSLKALQQERLTLGARDWNALYQQYPTTEEGAILKAAYWRKWPSTEPPTVEYIVQSVDGAYEEDEENDYSARTTWGVFDIFHQDNARLLQSYIKDKKRHEVQRYYAVLVEA